VDALLILGRIGTPAESLFYYDVDNGFDFEYYRNTSSYNPTFDFTPTEEQEQAAQELCSTDDGNTNQACVYDYYATGNNFSAGVSGDVSNLYTGVQNSLGLCSCHYNITALVFVICFISFKCFSVIPYCHDCNFLGCIECMTY